jgi:hypothetical protein
MAGSHHGFDLFHGYSARHLTGRVSTHAIGHDEQTQLLVGAKVVLVCFAFHPDIGGDK